MLALYNNRRWCNYLGQNVSLKPSFILVRAKATKGKSAIENKPAAWSPPKLDPNTPCPIFGGSTGGLLRKAQVEEFYVITWEAKKEQIFEMPTGGAAIMRQGPNLLKLARKEQCQALLTQPRTKFKTDGCYYRVFPDGEVEYLHPKDGVYPEKVNAGRQQSNCNDRRIGQNVNPINVKFTGSLGPFDSDMAKGPLTQKDKPVPPKAPEE